jgi:hypothetical protein
MDNVVTPEIIDQGVETDLASAANAISHNASRRTFLKTVAAASLIASPPTMFAAPTGPTGTPSSELKTGVLIIGGSPSSSPTPCRIHPRSNKVASPRSLLALSITHNHHHYVGNLQPSPSVKAAPRPTKTKAGVPGKRLPRYRKEIGRRGYAATIANGWTSQATRSTSCFVGKLKEKGFIIVTVVNQNERTIHVSGKYAYANAQKVCELRKQTTDLTHRWTVNTARGGMKKTST